MTEMKIQKTWPGAFFVGFALMLWSGAVKGQMPTKDSMVGKLFFETQQLGRTSESLSPEDLRQRARILREQAMPWKPETDGAMEYTMWTAAVCGSFARSLSYEWTSLEARRAGLAQWLEVLKSKSFVSSPDSFGFQLCRSYFTNICKDDPGAALEFITWVEMRFAKLLETPEERPGWAFQKGNFAANYLLLHPPGELGEEEALRAQCLAMADRILADEFLPLGQRTSLLDQRANALYSAADMAGAARLYDEWWQRHPQAELTAGIRFTCFCLAQFGQGDVETARRMLATLDQVAQSEATGNIAKDLKIMTETYYEDLRLSTPERWRKAANFAVSSRGLYLRRIGK